MTIAYWTILIAIFMPWVLTIFAKTPAARKGKYNNSAPRDFLSQVDGYSQRAYWAQQNTFEILPGYLAAIIVAHLAGAEQSSIDGLAVTFIVSRIVYAICYLMDWATLRSLVWSVGVACILGLFFVAV
jgi:uncharacterized MAPEG superfamily protein